MQGEMGKMHNKKELNWNNNEKIYMYKYLWRITMNILLDHMIKESGEERQFAHLPEMCWNYPVQLGELTSESFSERMISAATHWHPSNAFEW